MAASWCSRRTAWAALLGWLHVQDVIAIAGSLWTVS
jgi:uncharacterized membrane protein